MTENPYGEDAEQFRMSLARAVRNTRQRRGLSLSAVARSAGLSKSTLSQLEAGKANPNIDTLWAIAKTLGVSFGDLVEDAQGEFNLIRAGSVTGIPAKESVFVSTMLAAVQNVGGFEFYVIDAEPSGVRHSAPHPWGVIEHMFMCAGKMSVTLPDRNVVLGEGDYLRFSGDVDHSYEALEPDTRIALIMQYPRMAEPRP